MRRDPICGMPGVIERHGEWFCSERCAEEFARRQAKTPGCHAPILRWYADPWIWVPASAVVLSTLGWWWPWASSISHIYVDYLRKVGLPFVLGLVLGGFIDHFVPKEYIVRWLSGPRKRVIARATLLGFLASSCSHGCLALTIELYRKGASVPAVVSFLLASPWASMSLTFILLSLFGAPGLLIVGLALAIAWTTGLIFQRLDRRGLLEVNPHTMSVTEAFSIGQDVRRRFQAYRWNLSQLTADARGVVQGMIPLGRMVLGWVQLGLVLSALVGGLVPEEVFHRFLGPSVLGLLLTLGAAAIFEVCSEGTAPVAFELYRHTGALGNAFAFLMGGVITDYTELAAVWANIGRRTVGWLLLITLPLVMVIGLILNSWR